MTKKQKIWLAIFLAMFLIPEILWSDLRSFIYEMLNPNKFSDLPLLFNLLPATTNNILNAATALIQFIGLVGVFVFAVKLKINLILRIIIIIFLFLLLFFDGIIVWMAIYYLSHSPQIG